MSELVSVMSPRRSAAPTGRISSPVGMIATTGRRATATVACPPAAAAARSPGRSRRPAGTSSSPAAKSSPAARTFLPRAAATVAPPSAGRAAMSTPPSSCGSSRSRIDHGVGARRHRVAGVDPLERPGRQPHRGRPARAGSGAPRRQRRPVGRAHRDAVHRGAVATRGDGQRAVHRRGGDPAERLVDRDPLGTPCLGDHRPRRQPARASESSPPRVGDCEAAGTRATGVAHADRSAVVARIPGLHTATRCAPV